MQKNNPNNYIQEHEIDLREFLNLLINAKIIIIVITSICTIIAASYTYTQKPVYVSTAKFIIGHYDNVLIQNFEDIASETLFFFEDSDSDANLSLKKIGTKFFSIEITSSSIESANNKLKEMVDYIINTSNKNIDKNLQTERAGLDSFSEQISFISKEQKRISKKEEKKTNTDSRNYVFASESELIIKLNELQSDKNRLNLKLTNPHLYKYTTLQGEIKTIQRDPKKLFTILVGFIIGFILSIIFVYTSQTILQEKK